MRQIKEQLNVRGRFKSIDIVRQQLTEHRYINDESLATIIYLSYHLGKPMFIEGEPLVGKTEVALLFFWATSAVPWIFTP